MAADDEHFDRLARLQRDLSWIGKRLVALNEWFVKLGLARQRLREREPDPAPPRVSKGTSVNWAVPVHASKWGSPPLVVRALEPARPSPPIAPQATAPPEHEPPDHPGDSTEDRRVRRFLHRCMVKHPTGFSGRSKSDFSDACMKRFKVSRRRFDAIWDACINQSGAVAWRNTGPRGPHKARRRR
jgi:hypothetical protein